MSRERGREDGDGGDRRSKTFRGRPESASRYEKLQSNEIFKRVCVQEEAEKTARPRLGLNLVASDGRGHLFVWDSREKLLHYVDVQHSDSLNADADTPSLFASKRFKSFKSSPEIDFNVRCIKFNRAGRSLAIAGDTGLVVVDLVPHLSAPSDSTGGVTVCRPSKVGGGKLFSKKSWNALRILQVEWHPYSDTHLGVLSTDGVLRLFDLSLDVEEAEQEYHLQAELPSRPGSHPLARAVSFAFGGEHLWDRFTVFILFNNGSIYVLCPIVPFGSMFNGAAIDELVKDAMHFTLPSSTRDSTVVRNASLALAWLESVFTGLAAWSESTGKEPPFSSFMLKAHAHVPLDASVLLQGPLSITGSVAKQAENIAYTVVGSDSILAVSGKLSCVHLYGVDDEMQPMWNVANPPRLTVDDDGHILSVGMLAQVAQQDQPSTSTALISVSNQDGDNGTDEDTSTPWTGQPAPLVGLADVELTLQESVLSSAPISLFVDPVVPERLYCHHAAGMDAIILQWLPFSDDSLNKRFTGDPLPSLVPLLDTCPSTCVAPSPLLGVTAMLDPLGETWLVAITSRGDCAVVEVKPQRLQASPLYLEGAKPNDDEGADAGVFQTMSRELLLGPKDIPIPQIASSGTPLTVDSIEGRAFLHDQCKLLHEKYIQYAHRVHVELTSFGTRLHQNVEDQHKRLQLVQDQVKQAQRGTGALGGRIEKALEKTWQLEQRIKACSNLPGLRHKPLTEAELEFKSELDAMRFQNHEIFRSVLDVLSDRCERVLVESQEYAKGFSASPSRMFSPGTRKVTPYRGKPSSPVVSSSQMCHLKAAVEQLVGRVATTISNLDLVDDSMRQRERLLDR
ncbi:hypothetical protein KC19_VG291700 [Ceratodon purpureus]|uniref:Uncharacterized protein n=1 Tax=Ceratodon purpureus TaxID=3225 RepID=A0A8T0HWF0_CERPU|nr:hypothetical protein KC19_VG291700 [Ceratodon purpureus]